MSIAEPLDINVTQDEKANTSAVCPYCLDDRMLLTVRGPFLLGSMQSVIIYCGNDKCRKIFNVQVLGIEQPRIAVAPPPNRFH